MLGRYIHIKKHLQKIRDYFRFYQNCLYFRIHALLSDELVLYIHYPGLGDHLFYSHLPRLMKESGRYSRVYISSFSEFRSNDTKKLVWDLNPFVDGFIPKKSPSCTMNVKVGEKNLLAVIAYMYGLNIDYADPEIFYEPKLIPALSGVTLYDPNYISNAGAICAEDIKQYFEDQQIAVSGQLVLREKNMALTDAKTVNTPNIFDFIDTLFSVKSVYCLTTGTATICSAIGKKAHVLYGKGIIPMHHHSKTNEYILLGDN
jgi:hypothetical protein